ncbi:phosphatase PAP2 family protein [Agrobacterium vitis]|uniref:Phosphatase PAP2 family protein n=2 Tax=Agrobacterium vitis TaxID=373 RepID=A0AAE4WHW5_AGRVI|nr:phosphatase PAP2 family protein [Allorhizobium sp. Av2]MUZ59938.1 phosphatase PAP2 family protein [Agrobacterium vitis]MVA67223.1 phosphatase PAP2 family protein [Agrobacterium vitis]MVA89284.1 phosphatase PAP2 family protein [Agrobacterium vitis]
MRGLPATGLCLITSISISYDANQHRGKPEPGQARVVTSLKSLTMKTSARKPQLTVTDIFGRHCRIPDLTRSSFTTAALLSTVWVMLLVVFYSAPGFDVAVSELFFRAGNCTAHEANTICGGFPISREPILKAIRQILFYMPHVVGVGVLVALIVKLCQPRAAWQQEQIVKLVLSLLATAIGPYLLVNVFLKDMSGRPRPNQTVFFGGPYGFEPAGNFAGACDQNCSFISGEAAGAGWIICIVPLLPATWRRRIGWPLVFASFASPLLRLAFGAHYLSDVVLGWLSSPVIFAIVFAVANGCGLLRARNQPHL